MNGREHAQKAAPELHAGKEKFGEPTAYCAFIGGWRHLRLTSFDQASTMRLVCDAPDLSRLAQADALRPASQQRVNLSLQVCETAQCVEIEFKSPVSPTVVTFHFLFLDASRLRCLKEKCSRHLIPDVPASVQRLTLPNRTNFESEVVDGYMQCNGQITSQDIRTCLRFAKYAARAS